MINDAWDEPYEGKLNGDWGEGSLHTEGRAVTLQRYNDNNEHDLKELARLAVCAGVDYVEHKGNFQLNSIFRYFQFGKLVKLFLVIVSIQ